MNLLAAIKSYLARRIERGILLNHAKALGLTYEDIIVCDKIASECTLSLVQVGTIYSLTGRRLMYTAVQASRSTAGIPFEHIYRDVALDRLKRYANSTPFDMDALKQASEVFYE